MKDLNKKISELHIQSKNLFNALKMQETQHDRLRNEFNHIQSENNHLKDEITKKNGIISQYTQFE